MKKYSTFLTLLVIAAAAFSLRFIYMPSHLFFGPEQGRDFLVIRNIVVSHKLTLIGSKTDTAGIFHGPIFYYLASIPFALSQGDPMVVFTFFVFIQCMSVFLMYQLTCELTKSRRAGYIAAIVFAVSYVFVVYARWLSNPPLSVPLSLLFMLSLLRFIRGKQRYLIVTAIAYGLVGQAEFINFLLFGVIGLTSLCIWRKRFIKTSPITIGLALAAGFTLSFGTYLLFDIRHNFLISKAVLYLVQGRGVNNLTLWISTGGAFRVLLEQIAQMVSLSGWVWGLILIILVLPAWYKRVKRDSAFILLALWIGLPPVLLAILRHGMLDQLYAGIIAGVVILFAIAVDWLWEKKTELGIAVLAIVIGINAYAVIRNLSGNDRIFFQSQQSGVRYTDQLSVLDWVYTHAHGSPFSFQTFTIPWFFQDAWTYLLQYYAEPKYGYLPDNQGRKRMYIVIQKDPYDSYNSLFRKNWHTSMTQEWKTLTSQEQIGDYIVEEWTL